LKEGGFTLKVYLEDQKQRFEAEFLALTQESHMHYIKSIKLSILALSLAFVFVTISASSVYAAPRDSINDWLCSFLCIGNTSAPQAAPSSSGGYYQTMAYNDAVAAGIPPTYFVNQINAESHFNPNAVSSAGAIGIAQFEPEVAASLGIDPWNAEQSLRGAANLMASYNAKYGDYKMALASYQCGPGCLQSAINRCGYWYWCVPASTQAYISKITG
jgi:soluble lytic murein transglycosylase-like protein